MTNRTRLTGGSYPGCLRLEPEAPGRGWGRAWERLVRLGLGEIALRVGTGLASIALILLVVWVMGNFYLKGKSTNPQQAALAAAIPTMTPEPAPPSWSICRAPDQMDGIYRLALLHTILPDRPRFEVTIYEVQKGDTLFGIAEKFKLKPETLLFGNYDYPERYPGQPASRAKAEYSAGRRHLP